MRQNQNRWMAIAGWIAAIIGLCVLIVTLAGAIPSNYWWIRVWDFPRLIILTVGGVALIMLVLLKFRWRWSAGAVLLAALLYQAGHIYPYTWLASAEAGVVEVSDEERSAHCFTALSLNVLQDNRDYRRTIDLIEAERPDLLLLMEIDQAWLDAMEPVLVDYRHRFEAPLSNKYGMVFATRLRATDGRILNLAEAETPSVHATLHTPAGQSFRLAALHPRPPHPGQDTQERDAEIAIAAMMTRDTEMPALSIGDFNDVGWSETAQLFRRTGRYVDPRIGRGFYATFPASWPAFRWPLDHVFFTEELALLHLSIGAGVGSDHLPVHAEICLVPGEGRELNNPEEAEADDAEDIEEVM
ncbi:MAG: endonuclease, partial [Sphingomonadaceae bacterium]|nr:endonuclease [Sphingomonadaceae bacterium]